MTLADAVNSAAGQPATVRVGTVVDASPLQVSVQGTVFSVAHIGTLPSVGDTVLMLGQSVLASGSSGSSWICLGTIVP